MILEPDARYILIALELRFNVNYDSPWKARLQCAGILHHIQVRTGVIGKPVRNVSCRVIHQRTSVNARETAYRFCVWLFDTIIALLRQSLFTFLVDERRTSIFNVSLGRTFFNEPILVLKKVVSKICV